jgi:hypothetical protein
MAIFSPHLHMLNRGDSQLGLGNITCSCDATDDNMHDLCSMQPQVKPEGKMNFILLVIHGSQHLIMWSPSGETILLIKLHWFHSVKLTRRPNHVTDQLTELPPGRVHLTVTCGTAIVAGNLQRKPLSPNRPSNVYPTMFAPRPTAKWKNWTKSRVFATTSVYTWDTGTWLLEKVNNDGRQQAAVHS